MSVLTNSVHKPLEFSFTTLYFCCCHSYLNVTGSDSLQHQQQKEETALTKCMCGSSCHRHCWCLGTVPRVGLSPDPQSWISFKNYLTNE